MVGSLWLVLLFLAGGFQPARGPASWAVVAFMALKRPPYWWTGSCGQRPR